jgi:hypothetical protein
VAVWGIVSLSLAAGAQVRRAAAPSATATTSQWQLAPDVPAPASQPGTPLAAAADPTRAKPTLAIAPVLGGNREVVVPNRPSRFALTVGYDGWELWDLKLGEKAKEGRGRIDLRDTVLSPDGQYVAGYSFGRAATAGVEVWSLRTGTQAYRADAPQGAFGVKAIGFVNADRLVVHASQGPTETITVHDIPGKKEVLTFNLAKSARSFAMSRSGRYLVAVSRDALDVYDLTTGKAAGHADFPGAAVAGTDPVAAFDNAGKELAVAIPGGSTLRVIVLSVADGKVLADTTTEPKTDHPVTGKTLQYNPDDTSLLLRDTVIDRASLEAVFQLPPRDNLVYTRWADPSSAIMVYTTTNRVAFQGVPVDKTKIAKSIETPAAGGNVEDAGMFPLTPVNMAAAKNVSLDNAASTPWNVQVWDPTSKIKTIAAAIPLKPATNMPIPQGTGPFRRAYDDKPTALLFTSRETHAVFIEHAATSDGSADEALRRNPFHRAKAWIERHDLVAGALNAQLEIPPLLQVLDASETGKTLVFRAGSGADRLELWALDKAVYKPILALRPFGEEKTAAGNVPNPTGEHTIVWAALIDDSHVLALSGARELACFDVPAGKPLWRATLTVGAGNPYYRGRATADDPGLMLSPDRKLAAATVATGVCVFDPLTGKALNGLPNSAETIAAQAVGFSPDGGRLAALIYRFENPFLQVYDLHNGATLADIPLPARSRAGSPQFLDPDHVLLPDGALVSLQKKAIVWNYQLANPDLHRGSVAPYDRYLYVSRPEGRISAAIVSVPLLTPEVKAAEDAINPDELYTWMPGMSVKLSADFVGPDDFKKAELARWKQGLTDRGIVVADDAPNELRVHNMLLDGGDTQYVDRMSREKVTLHQKIPGYSIVLQAGGKDLWKTERTKVDQRDNYGAPSVFVTRNKDESMQQALDREYKTDRASTLLFPPMYIFRQRDIPVSRMGPRGLERVQVIRPPVPR